MKKLSSFFLALMACIGTIHAGSLDLLDSTVTVNESSVFGSSKMLYQYNDKGSLVRKTRISATWSKWTVGVPMIFNSKTVYVYDDEGHEIDMYDSTLDTVTGKWTDKHRYLYDEWHNKIYGVGKWNADSTELLSGTRYIYDGNHFLIGDESFDTWNGVKVIPYKYFYTNDENGYKISMYGLFRPDSAYEGDYMSDPVKFNQSGWKYVDSAYYERNAAGKSIRETFFRWDEANKQWLRDGYQDFTYDEQGHWLTDTVFARDFETNIITYNNMTVRTYDSYGNLTQSTTYLPVFSEGSVEWQVNYESFNEYTYNENGQLITKRSYTDWKDGAQPKYSTTTYYYSHHETNENGTIIPEPEPCIIASGTCGTNLTWELTCDSVLTIRGTGAMTKWSSASSVPWYSYRNAVKAVNLPEGLTTIGNYAFYNCTLLTSIDIPNSVTGIGSSTFSVCKGLTSIELPDGLISIGGSAFSGCTGLTSITLPESLTSIGDNAFSGCTNISGELVIPNSVNSIGSSAFYGCNLSKVTINSNALVSKAHTVNTNNNFWKIFGDQELEFILGDSIKSIGAYAFWGSRMTKISMPAGIKSISNFAFNSCRNITTITIPDSTTYIGEYAFATCQKLSTVKLGKSIASMGTRALGYGLKCLEITNPTPPDSIRVSACGATPTSCELLVPEDILEAYKNAPFWRNFYIINIIGGDHTVIFKDWNGNELSRVQVPDGGSAVDLAPTPPAVEHQVFIGWSQGLTNVTQSMTVYAQYEPVKVFVQFVDWDGTVLKSDSVYYQGWVEAPDNPYRRGYYFTGWDKTFTWEDLVTDLVITAQYEALPEGSSFVREDGGIHALFSVGEDKQVLFSRGNLQFNAAKGSHACADGTTQAGTWRFAPEQYNVRTWENYNRGSEYDNWIDLFAFGATGYNGNLPTMDETTVSREMDGERSYYDFGLYNAISNGGNNPGEWRMFTQNEWRYLIQQRPHANKLHAHAKIPREYDYIYGVIVLPDDGDTTLIYKEIDYNDPEAYLNYDPSVPTYTLAEWRQLEAKGALFFPAGGLGLVNNGYFNVNAIENGYYLVSFTPPSNYTNLLAIGFDTTTIWSGLNTNPECISVRLVKDAPISHLNAVANNSSYGSISGETIYFGEDITITATPNEGYHFVQWSDGITDNPRTFNLTSDSTIIAEFAPNTYSLSVTCDAEQGSITGESGEFAYLSEHTFEAVANHGYTFKAWSDGETANPRTVVLMRDSTITALYDINYYPVVLLGHDGKLLSKQTVAYKHAAQQPEVPVREGYTFSGWSTDIESILDSTYAIALYNKIGGTVTYLSEEGDVIATENVDLHLPAAPMISGKTFAGWLTESVDSESGIVLRATYTTDNPTTHDDVSVVPGSTTAAVNFPYITGALTYELVIRDLFGHVVCKILFNSTGHLLGIALAPGRNRTAAPAQTDGFNFTVEGLDPNTTYNYEFVAHDDTDEVIETLSGSFTTTDEILTGMENVQSNNVQCKKELRNDHVYILRGEKVYTITGQEAK